MPSHTITHVQATREKEHDTSIKDMSLPGLATPMGGANSTVSDLTAIGEGRGTVLELKLDRMADSVTGQTVVDPKVRVCVRAWVNVCVHQAQHYA